MPFVNNTGEIGQVLQLITLNLTGSIFMTYLILFLVLMILGMLFKLPVDISLPIMLPLAIIFALYEASFVPVLGLIVLYLSVMFAKYFIAN